MWFREDLRVADNPALRAAAASERPVIAIYILDRVSPEIRRPGRAQQWMLHHALAALEGELECIGLQLVIRTGPAEDVMSDLVAETGAKAAFWNRRYGGAEIAVDSAIKRRLGGAGLEVKSFQGSLLHEPTRLLTAADEPYKVYSPFWRAFTKTGEPRLPHAAPQEVQSFDAPMHSVPLDALKLLPSRPDWAAGFSENWPAGEAGAKATLDRFLQNGLAGYAMGRDFPAKANTSLLSPYLRFGMISPHQAWHAASEAAAANPAIAPADVEKFHKELGWREFSYHLLYHYPELRWRNFNPRFDAFPWAQAAQNPTSGLADAWKRGQTGYPIVDAGMRQLWKTGYMHNRVRMIVASFLVKHLMIDWRVGEEWFWDTLVDGDPANNPASWQWIAGAGADAAPYFRVFNPVLQSRKFDPTGSYVRRYVPEIAGLADRDIHAPWEAGEMALREAGIVLGSNYPEPVVDHGSARARALNAFQSLKKAA